MLIFAVSAFALIGFIYWTTSGFMASQTDDTVVAEITGLEEQYRRRGLPGLRQIIIERSADEGLGLYLLANADKSRIAGNLSAWPDAPTGPGGWIDFTYKRETKEGIEERAARARHLVLIGNFQLLVGRDVRERREIERQITDALTWSAAVTIALGLVGGFFLSRNMIRRIEVINRTSRDIMEGDFTRRVPLSGADDEFDELAGNLNDMLDQIERLMAGMREVADNIAHDLRTPLNRLRSRLELAQMKPPSDVEYRETLETALAEADGLIHTFNALLLIAQAEAGSVRETLEDIDVRPVVADMVELYEPVAEAKAVTIAVEARQPAVVRGNRGLIGRAVANLIDNAIKFSPEGGTVWVTLKHDRDGVELRVADSGPGIPAEDRERVLQRFVRLEASRHTPGSGLGLSLVAAVARLHDAELTLGDNNPGLVATLRFPKRES